MTKIDIFSGFLGAGKTTLIKKCLKEAFQDEQIVLIENEFGEIGIDGGFLQEAGVQIREMNSGCICCSLVGDFSSALTKVVEDYHPDRILIEPSGVGKLSDIIGAIERIKEDVQLQMNSFVCVADAKKVKMYSKNFGEFYNNQIESANVIVLSRTQDVSEEKLKEVIHILRELNSHASIITTDWDKISGKEILDVMESRESLDQLMMEEKKVLESIHHNEECECGHHHHHDEECGCGHHHHHDEECECGHHHHHEEECECGHHHHHDEECECGHHHHHHDEECECDHHHHHDADEVFTSWGSETIHKYSKEQLNSILNTLSQSEEYGVILRCKGIVASSEEEWFYFDMVPQESEIRKGNPQYTGRICVIGSNLNEEKLASLFEI
ncbi:MAG: CobW family GTP-binding protein [Floccifex porci]|uniref:CobW family GTP-binding protein n=2 Tax=Floccifex porci TaxID=2606629 RepID=UPI002A8058CC|nr:CobW family GTP-binding protein [Floccifex porci]MDY4796219.1 CobW family GTP-binding protein [Floccifex porci]